MITRFILVLASAALAARGEPFDRIAVTVGKHVIAESEILRGVRCAAFLDEKPADFSPFAKRKSADRLVDEYLILEDAAAVRAILPGAVAVRALLNAMKARYSSEAAFQAALKRAQISENDLTEHLLGGLRMLRYSETRFRPESQVTEDELRTFYESFTAGRAGSAPDFEASRAQLELLLTSQRATEAMDRWLAMTRQERNIEYRDAVFQ